MGEVLLMPRFSFATSGGNGLSSVKRLAARHLKGSGWGDGDIAAALSCRVQDLARIPGWFDTFAAAGAHAGEAPDD